MLAAYVTTVVSTLQKERWIYHLDVKAVLEPLS